MRQMAPGLFLTLERSLKRMGASRISRNSALVLLVAANFLAIPLFLYFSSQFWTPPGENGPWSAPRDASFWGYLALPLLATGAFTNIVVIPKVMTELFYHKDFRLFLIWCTCLFFFFLAYVYDGSRKPNDYSTTNDGSSSEQSSHGLTMNRPAQTSSRSRASSPARPAPFVRRLAAYAARGDAGHRRGDPLPALQSRRLALCARHHRRGDDQAADRRGRARRPSRPIPPSSRSLRASPPPTSRPKSSSICRATSAPIGCMA